MTSFEPPATETIAVIKAVKVIDASALIAVLFDEPGSDEISVRLENAELIAPILLDLECANTGLMKLRRRTATTKTVETAFKLRDKFEIKLCAIEPRAIFNLALATGLTAYDAAYLHLARTRDAELVTLDKQRHAAFLSPTGR